MRGWETILFSFGIICELSGENEQTMRADFERIIKAVADASDLSPCQVLCNRRFPETIDARWIAVKLLREEGFYSSKIADYMNMTTRNVNYILFSVETRLTMRDKALSNILEIARKELGNSKEITA
jgi:hypothetical protein